MDWDDLRYVLAVSRAGTLAGAATRLGVTRTTVGRRLDAIEARLGVRLFDRTPDGLRPTPAGAELAATGEHVEGEVHSAEGRILGRDADLRGALRVSTTEVVYRSFADVFASFIDRYPGILLTIQLSNTQVSLRRREADVALRLSNDPGDALVGRRLGTMQAEIYAARSLAARVGLGAPLAAWPWISNDERSPAPWLDAWLAANAAGARIVLRTDDYLALRTALSLGIGVHFLPCFDGDADPALVSLGHRLTDEARGLWALTLPELTSNRRVRAFLDHCATAFATRRGLIDGERSLSPNGGAARPESEGRSPDGC
jgi:DNA-binding transcriptional LysR family regulator